MSVTSLFVLLWPTRDSRELKAEWSFCYFLFIFNLKCSYYVGCCTNIKKINWCWRVILRIWKAFVFYEHSNKELLNASIGRISKLTAIYFIGSSDAPRFCDFLKSYHGKLLLKKLIFHAKNDVRTTFVVNVLTPLTTSRCGSSKATNIYISLDIDQIIDLIIFDN